MSINLIHDFPPTQDLRFSLQMYKASLTGENEIPGFKQLIRMLFLGQLGYKL